MYLPEHTCRWPLCDPLYPPLKIFFEFNTIMSENAFSRNLISQNWFCQGLVHTVPQDSCPTGTRPVGNCMNSSLAKPSSVILSSWKRHNQNIKKINRDFPFSTASLEIKGFHLYLKWLEFIKMPINEFKPLSDSN